MSLDCRGSASRSRLRHDDLGPRTSQGNPFRPRPVGFRHRHSGVHRRSGAAAGPRDRSLWHGRPHSARHAAEFLGAAVDDLADTANDRHRAVGGIGRNHHRASARAPCRRQHDAVAFRLLRRTGNYRVHARRSRSRLGAAIRDGGGAWTLSRRASARRAFGRNARPAVCRKRSSRWTWLRSMRWS